jgi:hypothetical protein
MKKGNLFHREWTVGGGSSEHEEDLPTIGATMEFIKGHNKKKITVKCSANINRPGSEADWNTLTLDCTHHSNDYMGTVMIGGFAKVAMVKYLPGGGTGGKDGITCDFNDLITPVGMVAPNTHLGYWHGDD